MAASTPPSSKGDWRRQEGGADLGHGGGAYRGHMGQQGDGQLDTQQRLHSSIRKAEASQQPTWDMCMSVSSSKAGSWLNTGSSAAGLIALAWSLRQARATSFRARWFFLRKDPSWDRTSDRMEDRLIWEGWRWRERSELGDSSFSFVGVRSEPSAETKR